MNSSRIFNIGNAKFHDWTHGDNFKAKIAWVGAEMGSNKLGFNVTEIAPGKSAFPCHAHIVNEELFFILEGRGTIRIGEENHKIKQGDFISIPPGRELAHQIKNNSRNPLRFIAISTMEYPEIAVYPDSGKYGVMDAPPRRDGSGNILKFYKIDGDVNYWEGEK